MAVKKSCSEFKRKTSIFMVGWKFLRLFHNAEASLKKSKMASDFEIEPTGFFFSEMKLHADIRQKFRAKLLS